QAAGAAGPESVSSVAPGRGPAAERSALALPPRRGGVWVVSTYRRAALPLSRAGAPAPPRTRRSFLKKAEWRAANPGHSVACGPLVVGWARHRPNRECTYAFSLRLDRRVRGRTGGAAQGRRRHDARAVAGPPRRRE